MIDLSAFEIAEQSQQEQDLQQTSLYKKAAEESIKKQQAIQSVTPEIQAVVDEMLGIQERDKARVNMQILNDAMMQNAVMPYGCGGCIKTYADGGSIHINPSKRGTFTAAASRHGMGVQEFASRVLANKENYSPAMVKKANFARNSAHWHAGGGDIVNCFGEGGSPTFSTPADMIEHFEGFRESPYRDGSAWSVGYGQYMKGDGANLDWNALLSGRKKLTRAEGHQQVLRSISKLEGQLKKTLGADLYNSLTPGQKMAYLDTGYQRPASMVKAAKVHKEKGANAASQVIGVPGFGERNAARRAAFNGEGGGYDYQPYDYAAGSYSDLPSIDFSSQQQNTAPWYAQQQLSDADYDALYNTAGQQMIPLTDFDLAWNLAQETTGTYPNLFAGGGYIESGLRSLGVTGFRVTSGYRGPNSKVGKAGKRSGHAHTLKDGSSAAIDIVPTDKSARGWANLEAQLRDPRVQNFLAGFGGTILAETDAATMKKTGATGPHYHIGLGVKGGGNFYNNESTVPGYYADYATPQFMEPISFLGQADQSTPWYAQASSMTDEDWAAL